MPLTERKIQQAKPRKSRYLMCDGDGLNLEVMTSGSKFWRLRYREGGRERRVSLGRYPYISLAEARAKREELRWAVAHGKTVSEALHPPASTFREVALEWLEGRSQVWTPRTLSILRRRLEMYLFPSLGDRPLREITAQQLLIPLRALESAGLSDTAQRLRQAFGQIARFGVAIGSCDMDVSVFLAGALKPTKVKPMSALTRPEDIRRLVRAMMDWRGSAVVGAALWFSLYTLARPGEVREAEWREVDLEGAVWTLPPERTKTRRSHSVPLCRPCVKLLRWLHGITGRGRFLFPSPRSPRGDKPRSGGLLEALRRMGFSAEEMTVHGFRALGSTRLNEMGFKPDLIEAALAHIQGGVRSVYNRTDYWEERVVMMEAWGDWLEGLKKPEPRS